MRLSPFIVVASLALAACGGNEEKKADATTAAAASGKPAASAEAPKKEDPALTVTAKAPAVGTKIEEKETSEMKLKLSLELGGTKKDGDVTETESTVKKLEVLAIEGKAVTKAKVSYAEKKKTTIEDGKEKNRPKSPLDGKTYVLEMKGGKLEIADDKGKKVSKAEEEAVRKNNARFGKPDPILAAMPDKPIKVGDKVAALEKSLEEFFKSRDEGKEAPEIGDIEVKLTSIENPGPNAIGVFSVALTMSNPKNAKEPMTMKAPVKGTMKIRAKDGLTSAIALSGTVAIDSSDPKLKMSGKGDIKMAVDYTY